jgi:hypothetical protein
MKKSLFLFSILAVFSTFGLTRGLSLQAQDTIYPFAPDYPFFNDSAFGVIDSCWTTSPLIGCCCILGIEHNNVPAQTVVTGLALPYRFGTKPFGYRFGELVPAPYPKFPDTISIQGVIIQIDSNDYEHPTIHYTNPVVWNYNETPHVRPYDCHIAFSSLLECGGRDTVVEAYALYFDSPVVVGGTVYLGFVRKREKAPDTSYYFSPNADEGLLGLGWNKKWGCILYVSVRVRRR